MPAWLIELLGLVEKAPTVVASTETLVSGIATVLGSSGSDVTKGIEVAEDLAAALPQISAAVVANTPTAAASA